MEQLCKLYLELANVVPADCLSMREIDLKNHRDHYGIALLMIANGAAAPADVAKEALANFGVAWKTNKDDIIETARFD